METILELHSYHSRIFQAFTALPPGDIGNALFERACSLWADRPWSDFGDFLNRVEDYLEANQLSADRQEAITAFLNKQNAHYNRCCWLPEERPRVIEADESDLNNRRSTLLRGWVFPELDAIKPTDSDATKKEYIGKHLREVERRLSILLEERTSRPTVPTTGSILLLSNGGQVKEFTTDHAERLLDYPGSLWTKAPNGAVPTSLPPAEPKKELCYCQTHPNARTLDELPADCHVHETIRKHLPEIEEQIAVRKRADTSTGFRTYCESELARHVKNVGDLTKNLAHPTMYLEQERPQMLELKFWNLTLCELYKNELEPTTLQSPPLEGNHKFTEKAADNAYLHSTLKVDRYLTPEFLAEYRRFFRSYASLLTPEHIPAVFAQWLANGQDEEPFRTHDHLITGLEHIYADTAEPEQFLVCLKKLLEITQPLLANDKVALDLFPGEDSVVWLKGDGTSGRPMYGTKRENRLRAQHASRRLERWVRLKQKSPLTQLIAYLTTLPVVLRPLVSEDPYEGLNSEVCLPVYEHKDTKHILDHLLPDVREVLLTMSTETIQQALLAPLAPLANFSLDSFTSLKNRGKQHNGKNEIERLTEYYPAPYFEWEELKSSKHLLSRATVSPHFWLALSLSLTMRHYFAKMLYELYAPAASQEKQANSYVEMLLHIPVAVEIFGAALCYTISDELLDYDDFVARLLPKKRKFEQALYVLKNKHLRHLRHRLAQLVSINRDSIREKRAAYERGDYSLNMLPADFPALHFDLLNDRLHYPQVSPLFWSGFYSLVQYGQIIANEIIASIDARLGKRSALPFAGTAGSQNSSISLPENNPSYAIKENSDSESDAVTPSADDHTFPFTSVAFTWVEADKLAEAVGLTQGGRYELGIQKKAAFTGFIEALKEWKLIEQRTLPELHDAFGQHYNQIIKTDRGSTTRTDFRATTLRKLASLFPALRPNPTDRPRI